MKAKKLFKHQGNFQNNQKYSVHESKKLFKHHEKKKETSNEV